MSEIRVIRNDPPAPAPQRETAQQIRDRWRAEDDRGRKQQLQQHSEQQSKQQCSPRCHEQKVRAQQQRERYQLEKYAEQIGAAKETGHVIAVCVAFHPGDDYGYARVLGSEERIFLHKRALLTLGTLQRGKYLRCKVVDPVAGHELREARAIELFQN